MDYSFLIGRVKDQDHENKLIEVAHWLEKNKFSCLFTIIDGLAYFTVDPDKPSDWESENEFKFHAAEIIITALSKKLANLI